MEVLVIDQDEEDDLWYVHSASGDRLPKYGRWDSKIEAIKSVRRETYPSIANLAKKHGFPRIPKDELEDI